MAFVFLLRREHLCFNIHMKSFWLMVLERAINELIFYIFLPVLWNLIERRQKTVRYRRQKFWNLTLRCTRSNLAKFFAIFLIPENHIFQTSLKIFIQQNSIKPNIIQHKEFLFHKKNLKFFCDTIRWNLNEYVKTQM